MPCLNINDLESCIDTVNLLTCVCVVSTYFHKLLGTFMIFHDAKDGAFTLVLASFCYTEN